MIELFNRILFTVCRVTAWVGMVFLLGAVLVTTTDVVLRSIGHEGIFGYVDIVQLMVMAAAYLSIPYGFLSNSHVSVSIVVDHLGRRTTALTKLLACLCATGLMSAIAWFGYEQAIMQMQYGDISMNLGIPKIYYWIPLLYGSALSGLVCIHMSIEALYGVVTGKSGVTTDVLEEVK